MTEKENNRKCFKCGCSPAVDNVKLFRFPKPAVMNLHRCVLWAQYIFPERGYPAVAVQLKLHNEHRMLCQKHFKDKDFSNDDKKKLIRTAVPCDLENEMEHELMGPVKKIQMKSDSVPSGFESQSKRICIPTPTPDELQQAPKKICELTPIPDELQDAPKKALDVSNPASFEINKKNLSAFACRVCLYENQDNITMDCTNGWLDLFEYCFGVQIKINENARNLCLECAQKIKEFTKLKRKCLESESLWKSLSVLGVELGQNCTVTLNESGSDCEELKSKHNVGEESNSESIITLVTDNRTQKQITTQNDTNIEDCDSYKFNEKCIIDDIEKSSDRENVEYLQDDNFDECLNLLNENDVTDDNKLNPKLKRNCQCVKFYNYHYQKENFSEGCGLCEFTATDVTVLCTHLDEHFTKNDVECQLCDYTGRDFAEMVYHRYTHDNVRDKTLFCLKCLKRFSTPESLQFHFRKVHLGKKGGLCSCCGQELSSLAGWHKHVLRKHADANDPNLLGSLFICDCCGVRHVDRNEILHHFQERAGFYKAVCQLCGKTFARERNLKNHMKKIHSKHEIIKCSMCPKICKTKMLLKIHILHSHGEQKFVCEICSAKFRIFKSLRYHMLGHTKERPYKCDICPASYKTTSLLRIHTRKHTGLKPYVCSICQKAFSTKMLLIRHNSVHTNERAYKCEHCDKSFHYKKQLIQHCARAHPD